MEFQWRECYKETLRDLEAELRRQRRHRALRSSRLFSRTPHNTHRSSSSNYTSEPHEDIANSSLTEALKLTQSLRQSEEEPLATMNGSAELAKEEERELESSDDGEEAEDVLTEDDTTSTSLASISLHNATLESLLDPKHAPQPQLPSEQPTESKNRSIDARNAEWQESDLQSTWGMINALQDKIYRIQAVLDHPVKTTVSESIP